MYDDTFNLKADINQTLADAKIVRDRFMTTFLIFYGIKAIVFALLVIAQTIREMKIGDRND